jgi:hypothetical protein
VSQKVTQKQITIVKIDNRKQVRKRSNAVAVPPPPVLRGVSAQPQPIIPLPPPPDLYETNVLRQRVERLERVREPVRQPIRATIETQTEAPVETELGSTSTQTFIGAIRKPIKSIGIQTLDPSVFNPPVSRRTQTEAPETTTIETQTIPARFQELRERMRLRPVPDEPIRAEPAPEPPSPAPTERLEPAPAPSAFGRTLDKKQLRSIGVTRPQVLSKMGVTLDEYKQKIFDKSFDMTNRGYNALVASEKKRVRDAVLREDYGVV